MARLQCDISTWLFAILIVIVLKLGDAESGINNIDSSSLDLEEIKNNLFKTHHFDSGNATPNDECAIELGKIGNSLKSGKPEDMWALKCNLRFIINCEAQIIDVCVFSCEI